MTICPWTGAEEDAGREQAGLLGNGLKLKLPWSLQVEATKKGTLNEIIR